MQEGGSVGSSSQAFGFLDYVPYVSQTPVQPTVSTSTKGNTTSQAESILSDDKFALCKHSFIDFSIFERFSCIASSKDFLST